MDSFNSVTQVFVHSSAKPNNEEETDVQKCLTQNALLQITLDGPSMALTILAIIAAVHLFQPSITCIIVAALPVPWIIYNDFQNFLLLGPGGTPSTVAGYLKITYLRLFALSDPYSPCTALTRTFPHVGLHQRASSWLPLRSGPRPKIAGIAPHRQINQPGCRDSDAILRATLNNLASSHPALFTVGQSCFEKKGLALFAKNPINATCRGEICHVHHSDGSLHMNLHPDDARVVLEQQWGERHPLARGGWLKQYVPREFTMVYAPRNMAEVYVVCRIIEAAGYWVSGEKMDVKVCSESRAAIAGMNQGGSCSS